MRIQQKNENTNAKKKRVHRNEILAEQNEHSLQ
jgi:hypothetical protein